MGMKNEIQVTPILNMIGRLRGLGQDFIIKSLAGNGVHDIMPQHGDVLLALMGGPLNMGELAVATKRKKNTLTTLVQSLERNGYIARETVADDARVQLVKLTPKGMLLCETAEDISYKLHKIMWQDMSKADQDQLIALLGRVIDNLSGSENG